MLGRGRPWAAVHSGMQRVPGCPEAAARLVRRAGLRPRLVGADQRLGLAEALARGPDLLVLPGGGELADAWTELRTHRRAVRDHVAGGGRYLGLCLGAYLAGRSPGFGLLDGDTDQLAARPGAGLPHTSDTVLTVFWGGRTRSLFAQDPPALLLSPGAEAQVLARYANGDVAALVAPFGRGRVGLVGPHPEATPDWFVDAGLAPVHPDGSDLGLQLVERLVGPDG